MWQKIAEYVCLGKYNDYCVVLPVSKMFDVSVLSLERLLQFCFDYLTDSHFHVNVCYPKSFIKWA